MGEKCFEEAKVVPVKVVPVFTSDHPGSKIKSMTSAGAPSKSRASGGTRQVQRVRRHSSRSMSGSGPIIKSGTVQ